MSEKLMLERIENLFANFDTNASDNNITHFIVRCCCDC